MRLIRTCSIACAILAGGVWAVPSQTTVVFASLFSFDQTNGIDPQAGLVRYSDGSFYGSTALGGPDGNGVLYRITPSRLFTHLASFNGTNGATPRGQMITGQDGNLYGTTYAGGTNNGGTIFKFQTNGALTTLFSFSFARGSFPIAGLIQDSASNFYGTTALGGTNGGGGTVFEFTTNGEFDPLVSFDFSGGGGNSPYAGLLKETNGSFFGSTYQGGTNGYGSIYELGTNGTLTTLVSFNNTNGANPYAKLVTGWDGDLYGTTYQGGDYGYGTIFKIDGHGKLTTLVSFDNTNGAAPQAPLYEALDGNLYGTTSSGGNLGGQPVGHGTLFELATNGTFTPLIVFNGTNGDSPQGELTQDANGTFYGTTAYGGDYNFGTIFRFSIAGPPNFLSATANGATVTLTWRAALDGMYQVLYKTNLDQTPWANIGEAVKATNVTMTAYDVIGSEPQRFYRLLQLP
jgi:uncharacterized repeat protein (TIGR03803 family)